MRWFHVKIGRLFSSLFRNVFVYDDMLYQSAVQCWFALRVMLVIFCTFLYSVTCKIVSNMKNNCDNVVDIRTLPEYDVFCHTAHTPTLIWIRTATCYTKTNPGWIVFGKLNSRSRPGSQRKVKLQLELQLEPFSVIIHMGCPVSKKDVISTYVGAIWEVMVLRVRMFLLSWYLFSKY